MKKYSETVVVPLADKFDRAELKGGNMQKREKRKKQRISSMNLFNYISLDHNNQQISQGMGRTINMSETGLLIETPNAIDPEHLISLNVGIADERFKVCGQVVYTTSFAGNLYRTGIRFQKAPKTDYYIFHNHLNLLNKYNNKEHINIQSADISYTLPALKGPKCDYLYVVDEETYLQEEKIISQGNYGNWVWVVLDGWATVVREMPSGNLPIFKIGPGAFIGSLTSYLTTNNARTTSVIAAETIQLGLLDTEKLSIEYAALSPAFKDILISMSGQLKRIVDRVVLLKQGQSTSKEDLLDGTLLYDPDQGEFGLHKIIRGKGTVLHRNLKNETPLVNLYPNDYVGSLPFITSYDRSSFMVTRVSTGFEKKELHRGSLKKEFESLSQTIKNMIEFTLLKTNAASQLVEQITINKAQVN